MTGFSAAVRDLIHTRAGGMCERCGAARGVEIHHRRPRGMGGSSKKSTNMAANGLLLCSDCHRFIELNRMEARIEGLLLPQTATPDESAVKYRGVYTYLDNFGGLQPAPEGT